MTSLIICPSKKNRKYNGTVPLSVEDNDHLRDITLALAEGKEDETTVVTFTLKAMLTLSFHDQK